MATSSYLATKTEYKWWKEAFCDKKQLDLIWSVFIQWKNAMIRWRVREMLMHNHCVLQVYSEKNGSKSQEAKRKKKNLATIVIPSSSNVVVAGTSSHIVIQTNADVDLSKQKVNWIFSESDQKPLTNDGRFPIWSVCVITIAIEI